LVFDKGSAALANTLALDQARVGWVSALPWNQAPPAFREQPLDQVTALSSDHPGIHAAQTTQVVHGQERSCVLKYSASFLSEQIHSVSTSLATAMQALRRLSSDLAKPGCRLTETQIRTKIIRRLASAQFLDVLIRPTLTRTDGRWRLQFDVDTAAFHHLMTHRLGRTVLMTNRLTWPAEDVVAAYGAQQHVEQVFRGLKDGDWLGWGPMYCWTDHKIRIHAFYCMLGVSLLNYVHTHAKRVCPQITIEQMKTELADIYEFVLLYPPQGDKGPPRTATVQSRQTLTQVLLAQELGLQTLAPPRGRKTRVGKTRRRS
jgi:transposase